MIVSLFFPFQPLLLSLQKSDTAMEADKTGATQQQPAAAQTH